MGGWSIKYQAGSDSTVYSVVVKILQALTGWGSSPGVLDLMGGTSGAGPVAQPTLTMNGVAQEAIPAGKRGYISGGLANAASLFVGGSTVTNGGANSGIEVSPLGTSPLLNGPVYVIGTAPDTAGVVTV